MIFHVLQQMRDSITALVLGTGSEQINDNRQKQVDLLALEEAAWKGSLLYIFFEQICRCSYIVVVFNALTFLE